MRWCAVGLLAVAIAGGPTCAAQQAPGAGRVGPGARTGVASTVVGPGGGTLALPDGATVEIPAGALQRATTVSLREVSPPSNLQLGPGVVRVAGIYAIEPRLSSSNPIRITLPYNAALLPRGTSEGSISIYVLRDDGRLSMAGSVTPDPEAESSGQVLDVDNDRVTIRVRATAAYTLLALGAQ